MSGEQRARIVGWAGQLAIKWGRFGTPNRERASVKDRIFDLFYTGTLPMGEIRDSESGACQCKRSKIKDYTPKVSTGTYSFLLCKVREQPILESENNLCALDRTPVSTRRLLDQ